MIKVVGKVRITFQSHALWRAGIVDHTRRIHSAVGHSPESAYRNLKDRMERDGYELVAPQHEHESKGAIYSTSSSMARRSIHQLEANRRAHTLLSNMLGPRSTAGVVTGAPHVTEVVRAMTEAVKTGTGVVRYDPPSVLAPVDADPVFRDRGLELMELYDMRDEVKPLLPLDEVRLRDPQRVVPGYYDLRGHP